MKSLSRLVSIISLLLVGSILIWIGYQKFANHRNKEIQEITNVEQISIVKSNWLEIESCPLAIFSSYYNIAEKPIKEVLIPIISTTNQEYYLLTQDSTLLHPVIYQIEKEEEILFLENNIILSTEDADYLQFQKTTIEGLQQELVSAQMELDSFIMNYPKVVVGIKGLLLPIAHNSQFGFTEQDLIIQHNAKKPSLMYTWFLLIGGILIFSIGVLALVGFAVLSGAASRHSKSAISHSQKY